MQISNTGSWKRPTPPPKKQQESRENEGTRDLFVFSTKPSDHAPPLSPQKGSQCGASATCSRHTVELEVGSNVKSQAVECAGCGASIAGSGTCGYCGSHNVVMMEGMIVR
mgnify:CR=1 FL=1